jgi:NitT/TauT family transport system ATP-binding protein
MMGRRLSESLALADQYINLIGLSGFQNQYPHELSEDAAEVAIARVLVNQPEIFSWMSLLESWMPKLGTTMQILLLNVWEKIRPTILFITHDIDEAIFLGDRILVMSCRPGKIVKEFKVTLNRPRDYEIIATLAYLEIKREILNLLKSVEQNHSCDVEANRIG